MDTRTLRKNRLPAGRKTRCWVTLSGTPSLYQTIVGSGMPSALQFIVTGSLRGTVKSSGCSVIFGTWKATKKWKEWKRISWVRSLFRFCYILRFLPFFRNLVSNLIKLKVLFSVFSTFFFLSSVHSCRPTIKLWIFSFVGCQTNKTPNGIKH